MEHSLDPAPFEESGKPVRARREAREQPPLKPEFAIPIPASELGAGEPVEWVWQGYLARASSTLLTGLWKAGKTTLVAHLLAMMDKGGFLAGDVATGRALVVSEESGPLWAERRDAIGIGDHVHFILRPFKGKPDFGGWQRFVNHLTKQVVEQQFRLVILDPIANLLPIRDENDAASMMAALTPLYSITDAGASILLLHHPRKGDGGEGQAARGSGALPGFVDVILELRRYNAAESEDRRRTLTAFSRFDATPHEAVIELTDDGYRSCGTKLETSRNDRLAVLADLLPGEPPGLTAEQVRDSWPSDGIPTPGKRTVDQDLRHGARQGLWNQGGHGWKSDPFRYWGPCDFRARPDSRDGSMHEYHSHCTESSENSIRARSRSSNRPVRESNVVSGVKPTRAGGGVRESDGVRECQSDNKFLFFANRCEDPAMAEQLRQMADGGG